MPTSTTQPRRAVKRYNEDLFKDTTMTFGEHLEELRTCLFRALMGLLVGFVIGLKFADQVVLAIQLPLQNALINFYQEKAENEIGSRFGPEQAVDLGTIMRREGLIPDPVYVVGGNLQSLESGTSSEVNAAGGVLYRIAPQDLRDPQALARALSAEAAESDPAVSRVRELLPETDREAIDAAAEKEQLTDEDVEQLASALNQLLAGRDLYDQHAFSKVALSSDLMQLLGNQATLPADRGLRLLNWLLLSAMLPDQLGAPRVNLSPVIIWRDAADDERVQPQSLGVEESFMIWIKAALISGAIIASPWIFYQIWSFVAAGLYPNEKKYVHLYLPFSIVLFLAGAALAYFYVFEPVLGFLFKFNRDLGINPDPKIGQWLSFFLMLPVGFGISFQLPLVMLFLQRIGVFDVEAYLAKWRIAILVIFVLSAVLTPADPYSMLLMAVPLTILYFGGIALCRFLPGGRNPYAAE
jgi:sec-independent protein translocase protein TatC